MPHTVKVVDLDVTEAQELAQLVKYARFTGAYLHVEIRMGKKPPYWRKGTIRAMIAELISSGENDPTVIVSRVRAAIPKAREETHEYLYDEVRRVREFLAEEV